MIKYIFPILTLIIFGCSNPHDEENEAIEIKSLKEKSKVSRIDKGESIEIQMSQAKPDSSYVNYWCSSEILLTTEKNIDKLNLVIVADFLATFHESCKNNAEYSEWSNELLFKVLNNKPDRVIELLIKNSSLSRDYIIKELANPVNDGINIDTTIKKIQDLEKPKSDYWKIKIIESLNRAKEKN